MLFLVIQLNSMTPFQPDKKIKKYFSEPRPGTGFRKYILNLVFSEPGRAAPMAHATMAPVVQALPQTPQGVGRGGGGGYCAPTHMGHPKGARRQSWWKNK